MSVPRSLAMEVTRNAGGSPRFPPITSCPSGPDRSSQTVIADLDGTLLRGSSAFPYFFLIAFEAGSYLRAWVLLLFSPLIGFLYYFVRESSGIQLMMFLSFAGLKLHDIEGVSRAVLTKFYLEDLHPVTWPVFSSFGKRIVLTANPRVIVEPFLKEILGVDEVIGSEIEVTKGGRATGFARKPGVLVGRLKEEALERWIREGEGKRGKPDVGMGDRETDFEFMAMCKEGYVVPKLRVPPMKKRDLPKQLIFHDGRLVQRPSPGTAFVVLLWIPFGFLLALVRVTCGFLLPVRFLPLFYMLTGIKLRVTGRVPFKPQPEEPGVLYVCNHRTLLDPVVISIALGRPVPAVTYSISKVYETLSPVKTIGLCRDREKDSDNMRKVLEKGELTLCPEGTTCREPFLLRFSALFAELSDRIVPVAVSTKMTMFHGTTARGNKVMDPFFAYMNPRPVYEVHFLNELPKELTCASGKSSFEVANCIQRLLARALGYECTDFTRKDKYRLLVGNDGLVPVKDKKR